VDGLNEPRRLFRAISFDDVHASVLRLTSSCKHFTSYQRSGHQISGWAATSLLIYLETVPLNLLSSSTLCSQAEEFVGKRQNVHYIPKTGRHQTHGINSVKEF